MSRSNNQEIRNPATKFFEWVGSKGGFRFYDKEQEKRIDVPLPFRFLVLDCLSTIKGFSDSQQSGFWSNEIRNTKTDTLTVRNKNGICAEGLYQTVIANRGIVGAKYCQSVYIGYYDTETLVIGNIAFTGAALSAWIDFRKENKIFEGAITVDSMIEGRKGATVYQIPVFKSITVKPETDEKAKELDKELQKYLTAYFNMNKVEAVHDVVDSPPPYTPDEIPAEHGSLPENDSFDRQPSQQVNTEPNNADDDLGLPF